MKNDIRIMLVDDHQIIIDGLKALLENVDSVRILTSAVNGREALDKLKIIEVDVVLIDIDMPVLNGFDTMQEIKKYYPDIKVIILSMHCESAMVKDLIDAGADGYLLKNSSKDELVSAINKVSNGGRYFSTDVTMSLVDQPKKQEINEKDLNLTSREIEILKLIAEGYTNKEIGKKLFISHRTVDTHRTNLMKKIEVKNLAGLVNYAIKRGFLE